MREYQEEIAKLRALLEADGGIPTSMSFDGSMTVGPGGALVPLAPRSTLNGSALHSHFVHRRNHHHILP
jgi:PAB1-binding protein PBP1